MFDELLQVVITAIAESDKVNIFAFKKLEEYQYIKELFGHSFLGNQLFETDNAA